MRHGNQYREPMRFESLAKALLALLLLSVSGIQTCQAADSLIQPGNEIGLTLGTYRYAEPGLMSLQGIKAGVDIRSTMTYPERLVFIRGEVRFSGGAVDYHGGTSGDSYGEPDFYFEGRALIGQVWPQYDSVASYFGIGYRYLSNDARGVTSLGAAGYRRASNYLYLPIGIIFRKSLSDGSGLVASIEYDHLLTGLQFTQLSDTNLGYSDLTNKQRAGRGMKLGLLYTKERLTLGPYLYYWNIADSEVMPVYRYGVLNGYGLEPHNTTTEFGFELRQSF